jgi:hypothetical protein
MISGAKRGGFTLIVVGERRFYDPFCHFNLVAYLLVC